MRRILPRASYACDVSRLENIVARNERARRWQPMTIFKIAIGGFLAVALLLTLLTGLGAPRTPAHLAQPAQPTQPAHVEGVLLRAAPK
jgi:hypothetical protein